MPKKLHKLHLGGEGNTRPPHHKRSRRFCLTVFKTEEKDVARILIGYPKSIVGIEVCPETNNVHWQIYLETEFGKTCSAIKKSLWNDIHVEPARGPRKENVKYCSKDRNVIHNHWGFASEWEKPYPWQQSVLDLLNTEPDNRTVNWFWEPTGNAGKTALCRHLFDTRDDVAYIGACNRADAAFALSNTEDVNVVLIDIARNSSVSYDVFEMIKNGLFFSSKYESRAIRIKPVHLIVFANNPPNMGELSLDRWNIKKIGEDHEFLP